MEKKNFVWNLIGSVLNSFTSLFFMIIVTRINGIDDAGVFTFAFSIASLLQVIGSYQGRPFQVTNKSSDLSDSDFIYTRLVTCILMFLITIIYLLFKNYDITKSFIIILLVLFRMIEAYADSYYGILQKNDCLYYVGISLTLKAVLSVFLFLLIDVLSGNMIFTITSLIIIQLTVFVFYDIRNKNKMKYIKSNFDISKVKKIFTIGFSIFIVTILSQYLLQAPKFPIDKYLSDDKQTIYGIISMPATMMLLCSQFIIHPFLMKMNSFIQDKKYSEFKKLVYKLCFVLLLLGLICEIALYFIGVPILNFVYGVNLSKYVYELLFVVFGAILFGMSTIISYAMIAMEKNKIQSMIFCFASIICYILSNKLVITYGLLGASISYLAVMSIILLLYYTSFNYYIKKDMV